MGRISKLYIGKDDKGIVTNEIPWPSEEQSQQIVLINNGTEETLTVPGWAYRVSFVISPGSIVSCGYGDIPLVLAGNVWVNQKSEINPILRQLNDPNGNRIETLRFISYTDNAVINVIFYGQNEYEKS